jgi:hypothetical protein
MSEKEIRLAGKRLCVLSDPPKLGDNIDLNVRLHVIEDCTAQHEDETQVQYLRVRLVAAWKPGDPVPVSTQEPLWDQAGPEGSIKPETGEPDGDPQEGDDGWTDPEPPPAAKAKK